MASVPYELNCDLNSGFLPDPNAHKRVGYICRLGGFGLPTELAADIKVFVALGGVRPAYNAGGKLALAASPGGLSAIQVVGVIEKFSWPGGVGDAIELDFYCSQENAVHLKGALQSPLKNTRIDALGWWIVDYDQEHKVWYEASYPQSPPTVVGTLAGPHDFPGLEVDLTPVHAKEGLDVMVYKVSIKLVPAANQQCALHFANSSAKPVVKPWGLVVGTLAKAGP